MRLQTLLKWTQRSQQLLATQASFCSSRHRPAATSRFCLPMNQPPTLDLDPEHSSELSAIRRTSNQTIAPPLQT